MLNNNKVENFTCNGKCSGCGNCCTDFLPMSRADEKRIKDYLKLHPEIKEQIHLDSDNNMHIKCAFRDEVNNKCLIYPVRPQICRKFLCCQKLDTIIKTRDSIQANCFYNRLDFKTMQMSNMISTHALFFDNYQWELDFVYNVCKYDFNKVKKLLKHFHIHYNFIKED